MVILAGRIAPTGPGKHFDCRLQIGVCNASERACGAAVYLLSENSKGETRVRLICAKSRAAPLKTVTVPRLKLCAAVLLAKLTDVVKQALRHVELVDVVL